MEGDPAGLALPEDALAEILRRLPPRSLAASRCVCKAWRDIVDGRRLLLPELLPHSVRGIFLMYNDLDYPAFLSHPSLDPEILGKLDFYRNPNPQQWIWTTASVLSHCNGLLLYKDTRGLYVANPATQRRALLPPPPPPPSGMFWRGSEHIVFDPTESPHYKVLLVPNDPGDEELSMELRQQAGHESTSSMEWPASTWVLCVFSSCTGQWEERPFVREGEAAGMASDKALRRCGVLFQSCSDYWRGVFYVQCNGGLTVMRISLSNNKYRVIKMPTDIGERDYGDAYLGRSKEGLCCASFHDWYKLRVWILDDSCGKKEWVLKHHIDICHSVSCVKMFCEENEGPWKLQDANIGEDSGQQNLQDANNDEDDSSNALVKSEVEWDSDSDNIVGGDIVQRFSGYITVLGFHPYKDIIFLDLSLDRAVAYRLNTSVVQDLGKICPYGYGGHAALIKSSLVYTPCLMAEFPENKVEAHIGG
ncbi:unnamed protein product [Urochloa decumbens]|uniref:F-box domain-containing protein n=1 Tax=Urochloa decumbens TaxID=240449 RepID=A0ABC8Y460_9POAL